MDLLFRGPTSHNFEYTVYVHCILKKMGRQSLLNGQKNLDIWLLFLIVYPSFLLNLILGQTPVESIILYILVSFLEICPVSSDL